METPSSVPLRHWQLPPLILHPFADPDGPARLQEGSRAILSLHGLIPDDHSTLDQLNTKLLSGRYCELLMLYYIGKDLWRWAEQCAEFIQGIPELRDTELAPETFLNLLVEDPPVEAADKLRKWGVYEFKSIFRRAAGLHSVFGQVPDRLLLSDTFVRHYHRFADEMFRCHQELFPARHVTAAEFDFQVYASGEYSRMLEQQWESN
jgi:hypothetical protein